MPISSFIPGRVRAAWSNLKRDVTSARSIVSSDVGPTFIMRHTTAELDEMSRQAGEKRAVWIAELATQTSTLRADFRDLRVSAVMRTTRDSITIIFANSLSDVTNPLRFRAGQFITVLVTVDGEEHRRAYSFCSNPADQRTVAITVKRVKDGCVSNWLNDNVKPGMSLRTLGPSGEFGRPIPRASQTVLVAGGSGITPILSILHARLADDPDNDITLIFGNRNVSSIIQRKSIDALAAVHVNFRVMYFIERPTDRWEGHAGRLDAATATDVLPMDPQAAYYVCGPIQMMDAVSSALAAAGVPEARVQRELFVSQGRGAGTQLGEATGERTYSVTFRHSGRLLQVPDNKTILEAGLEAGIPMEFSCTMGGCAACKIRVVSGETEMQEPNCLTAKERAAGGCLACIAYPRGSIIVDA